MNFRKECESNQGIHVKLHGVDVCVFDSFSRYKKFVEWLDKQPVQSECGAEYREDDALWRHRYEYRNNGKTKSLTNLTDRMMISSEVLWTILDEKKGMFNSEPTLEKIREQSMRKLPPTSQNISITLGENDVDGYYYVRIKAQSNKIDDLEKIHDDTINLARSAEQIFAKEFAKEI